MNKKKSKEDVLILIAYKDTPAVKQQLRLIAAKEGHGSMGRVLRGVVRRYLLRERKKATG